MPAHIGMPDGLDAVWKALSDPTRRAILDLLRHGPRTTTEIVEMFPHLTRFGVMKHLDVLREARLVNTREEGRQRLNSLNAVPIRQIYERWVSRFEEFWATHLLRLKETIEAESREEKKEAKRKPRKSKRD
jgi:DNA-binding transcriptional ArsR family regulator